MEYSFNKVFADLFKQTESLMASISPAKDKKGDLTKISIKPLNPTDFVIDDVVFAIYGTIRCNNKVIDISEFECMRNPLRKECSIELAAKTTYGPLTIDVSLGSYEITSISYEEWLEDVPEVHDLYHCTLKRKG